MNNYYNEAANLGELVDLILDEDSIQNELNEAELELAGLLQLIETLRHG